MDFYRRLLGVSIVLLLLLQIVYGSDQCYCLKKHVDGIESPVFLEQNPQNGQFYVAEQSGVVHIYSKDWKNELNQLLNLTNDVYITPNPFDERGLLSLALHPNFSSNNLVFTYSIRKIDKNEYAVVSMINTKEGSLKEEILLAIQQKHYQRNGGQVLFGKDGYLYVSVGDGGTLDERNISYAQSRTSLLGKILRLDVDHVDVVSDHLQFYSVPGNNPFVGNTSVRPEIYAFGARNMWRCSVDKETGYLYCGDTGDKTFEEINWIQPGKNYGWNIYEGNTVVKARENETITNELPVYSYRHGDMGHAVIGGYVYRGKAFQNLNGYYIFGDYVSGKLFSLEPPFNGTNSKRNLTMCEKNKCPCDSRDKPGLYLQSFSTDIEGEIYILTKQNGEILQLIPPLNDVTTCGSTRLLSNAFTMILVSVATLCCHT